MNTTTPEAVDDKQMTTSTAPLGMAVLLAAAPLIHRTIKRMGHRPYAENQRVEEEALLSAFQIVTNGLCNAGAWCRSEISLVPPLPGFVLAFRVLVQPTSVVQWEDGVYHVKEAEAGDCLVIRPVRALERTIGGAKEMMGVNEVQTDDGKTRDCHNEN